MIQKIIIGIDPDLLKSGFCCIIDSRIIDITTLSFFSMVEQIKHYADSANVTNGSIVVYIEAGWLNAKKNFHGAKNTSIAARIGANVGENHAVGKLLEQAMIFYAIPYKLFKPTTAKWDANLFKQITGLNRRTNQEERDALKLIWGIPANTIF